MGRNPQLDGAIRAPSSNQAFGKDWEDGNGAQLIQADIISRALEQHGKLSHRSFALMTVDHDDSIQFLVSRSLWSQRSTIFTPQVRSTFVNAVRQHIVVQHRDSAAADTVDVSSGEEEDEDTDRPGTQGLPRREREDPTMTKASQPNYASRHVRGSPRTKKPSKPQLRASDHVPDEEDSREEGDSSSSGQAVAMTHQPLRINDRQAMDDYFESRCESVQQLNWKMILKAWIKEIEPRKQTTYPYNKKPPDAKPPPWWPPGIPHKEPDHSTKPHRMALAKGLLRIYQRLDSQIPDKCRRAASTVDPFEKATKDIMARSKNKDDVFDAKKDKEWFFDDSKKAILSELYRVARLEERLAKNNHVGPLDTSVRILTKSRPSKRAPKRRGTSSSESASTKKARNFNLHSVKAEDFEPNHSPGSLLSNQVEQLDLRSPTSLRRNDYQPSFPISPGAPQQSAFSAPYWAPQSNQSMPMTAAHNSQLQTLDTASLEQSGAYSPYSGRQTTYDAARSDHQSRNQSFSSVDNVVTTPQTTPLYGAQAPEWQSSNSFTQPYSGFPSFSESTINTPQSSFRQGNTHSSSISSLPSPSNPPPQTRPSHQADQVQNGTLLSFHGPNHHQSTNQGRAENVGQPHQMNATEDMSRINQYASYQSDMSGGNSTYRK